MQYLELKTRLNKFLVFSSNDIEKIDPDFHSQRLSEWQAKGYIRKLTKEFYTFFDLEINEPVLFLIANKIYEPSYVSLEMALGMYNLIPESVYGITSVASGKTNRFKTEVGEFIYRHLKPELMFGYKLIEYQGQRYKIAEVEKAVLDYLYLNSDMKEKADFDGWRFNIDEFKKQADMQKFARYLGEFKNKRLEARAKRFIKFLNYA